MKEVGTRRFGFSKRFLSFIIALLVLISVLEPPQFLKSSFITEVHAANEEYRLPAKIEDGAIFHAFDCSLSWIKSNLPIIAEQGFGAIQTMPVNTCVSGDKWWTVYQPTSWEIGNKHGTEAELRDLCTEAHKYGIKIIVDIIPNHMADWINIDQVSDEVKNIPNVFHEQGATQDWDDRRDVTQGDMPTDDLGLADLNTQNPVVKEKTKEFISKVAACGVDGFRIDAAKHIELPEDDVAFRGNFWSEITAHISSLGIDFTYGEILPGEAASLDKYAEYMSVPAAAYGDNICNMLNSYKIGYNRSDYQVGTIAPSKLVTWVESHDNFAHNHTDKLNDWQRNVGWALIASRAESTPLYLRRNEGYVNTFKSDEVKWVNQFRNAMVGYGGEYITSDGDRISIIERGPQGMALGSAKGAVIVSGEGGKSINNISVRLPNGSYQDYISGNTFTVSNGKISGKLGDHKGVAVLMVDYTPPISPPKVSADKDNLTYTMDTLSVTLSATGTTLQTYQINDGSAVSYTDGQTIIIGNASDEPGKVYTLTLNGTGSGGADTKTYTYTKGDPYVTITFDKNGGDKDAVPSSKRIIPSTSVGLPETLPTRVGYLFDGWYPKSNGTGTKLVSSTIVWGDTTYYAKWIPNPATCTIAFHSQGGSQISAITNVLSGAKIQKPAQNPVRVGYTFGGWYKEASCTNVWNFDSDTVTGSMILYAKWRPAAYKITYNLNKGKQIPGQAATYTFGIGYNLKNPTRPKYEFDGWYTTPNFKGANVKAISKNENGNKTYYAKWKQVKVNKGKLKNLSSKGKKLNITINKVNGANGYSIQYSTTADFKKGKTKTSTLTYKGNKTQKSISKLGGKKLKLGTTYYVRVRAYKFDSAGNKVWGKYSASKKIVLR